jgi:hypothetical protein
MLELNLHHGLVFLSKTIAIKTAPTGSRFITSNIFENSVAEPEAQ